MEMDKMQVVWKNQKNCGVDIQQEAVLRQQQRRQRQCSFPGGNPPGISYDAERDRTVSGSRKDPKRK